MRLSAATPWPGNLRELENTIKRYLILADEQAIIDELIPRQSAESSAFDGRRRRTATEV